MVRGFGYGVTGCLGMGFRVGVLKVPIRFFLLFVRGSRFRVGGFAVRGFGFWFRDSGFLQVRGFGLGGFEFLGFKRFGFSRYGVSGWEFRRSWFSWFSRFGVSRSRVWRYVFQVSCFAVRGFK